MLFTDMLSDEVTRDEIVTYFMAMLELIRLGKLHAQQDAIFGDILMSAGRKEDDGEDAGAASA